MTHPPVDTHAGAGHNAHDLTFLHNIIAHLEGTTMVARGVITSGVHPDVRAAATEVLGSHSAQLAKMTQLRGQVGNAGVGGSTTTSAAGSSGHGGGNAYGHNSAEQSGEMRAAMSGASVDNLPDSDFAYIEPGGTKDASGKTTPRSKRHFPINDAAHVRNALARASQSPFGKLAMPKILAAAKRFGIEVSNANSANQSSLGEFYRDVAFNMAQTGDGLTLEGYAAVFNSPTRIDSWEGRFDEVILPGAFRDSLGDHTPVLMFEHGRHPLIGTMPLGVIQRAEEDANGLYIEAKLSDNWLIQPVRDAVRDGAVTGMSFRFSVPEGGDTMQKRSGDAVPLRTINRLTVAELGPVVFPAYKPTTATVRSLVERLPDLTGLPSDLSPGGGESGARPGKGDPPQQVTHRQRFDDEALRLRGVLK